MQDAGEPGNLHAEDASIRCSIEGARNVITGSPHDAGPDSPIYADFKRRLAGLGLSAARERQLARRSAQGASSSSFSPPTMR